MNIMASVRKAALLSAYYIYAWTAITMGAKDLALIRLSLEGNQNNTKDYQFSEPVFEKFHSCLCNGNAAKCRAHYQDTNLGYYSVDIIYEEGSVSNNSISRTYKCTNVASLSSLSCEQQSLQALPDFSPGIIIGKSFIIPQSACGSKCVVLLWQFNVEEIILDNSVEAEKCDTNCACPSTTTTTTTGTSQAVFSNPAIISTEPKTASTSVATGIRTRAPTTSNVISTDTSNAANQRSKTTQEDTPIGLIIGIVIGVIIVITVIVIGIIIWWRRRAASALNEQMFHQIETPKESSEARTQGPKSKNRMDSTSDNQLASTNKSDLEGETYAVPHKTKHQQDFIPTGIAKNGTSCALSILNQQGVNEKNAPDEEYPRVKVGNVRNNDRSSDGGDYGYSHIDQELSKGSKTTPVNGLVNASGSIISDYQDPVMENDYNFVSVNDNPQTKDNPGIMDTNIDDGYSTIGNECHSKKPTSDTGFNSKNVYTKRHEEKREKHNPYNSLLSPKEDSKVRKPIAIPSQNNLTTNHSARHANAILNASSTGDSDGTVSVTDVPPSTNSQPMINTHGAKDDQNNGVHRLKPFDGGDEYAVVCKRKP